MSGRPSSNTWNRCEVERARRGSRRRSGTRSCRARCRRRSGRSTSKQQRAGREVERRRCARRVRGRAGPRPWRRCSSTVRAAGQRRRRPRTSRRRGRRSSPSWSSRSWRRRSWRRRRSVLPGADVPVTVTGEPTTDELSAGAVTVSGVWPCVWRDVALARVARAVEQPAGGRRRASAARTAPADQVSGDAEPAGLPFTKPIDADGRVGPERRAGEVGQLPRLLGDEADARSPSRSSPARRSTRRRRSPRVELALRRARRRAPATGARCPCPLGAHGWPSVEPSP